MRTALHAVVLMSIWMVVTGIFIKKYIFCPKIENNKGNFTQWTMDIMKHIFCTQKDLNAVAKILKNFSTTTDAMQWLTTLVNSTQTE